MRSLIFLALLVLFVPVSGQEKSLSDPADLAVQVLTEGASSLDPSDMLAWVTLPRSVNKGEQFTLTISIENARETIAFNLESIDLDGSFLRGFRIKSVTPSPIETDDSFNSLRLKYPMKIAAGETVNFVLEMIAVEAGVYVGEVNIWDEDNFLSRYVQCKVVK